MNKTFLTLRLQTILTCDVFYVALLLALRRLFTCNRGSIIAFSVKEKFKESACSGYWDIFQTPKKTPKKPPPKPSNPSLTKIMKILKSAFMNIKDLYKAVTRWVHSNGLDFERCYIQNTGDYNRCSID